MSAAVAQRYREGQDRSWLMTQPPECLEMVAVYEVEYVVARRDPANDAWSCGRQVLVRPAGELDIATAGGLRDRLRAAVELEGVSTIVVDFSDVTFVDAYSIGVIVSAWNEAAARGRLLRVVRLSGMAAKLFVAVGLGALCSPEDGRGCIGEDAQ